MNVFSRFYPSIKIGSLIVFFASLFCVSVSQATTVQFQTSMGIINVNLFDKTTPETVKNFLKYVDSRAYNNSVIHRSVMVTKTDGSKRPFVVQGGGYTFPDTAALTAIPSKGTVINEPVYSNLRGTIAMAKPAGNANGATSQWFFNLHNDNALSLDPSVSRSGGYTVFGQVDEASLPVLDAMVAVNTFIVGSGLSEFPLRDYTVEDYENDVLPDASNLIMIHNILVLLRDPNTADSLSPPLNTLLVIEEEKKSSGGGSLSFWSLLLLAAFFFFTRKSTLATRR